MVYQGNQLAGQSITITGTSTSSGVTTSTTYTHGSSGKVSSTSSKTIKEDTSKYKPGFNEGYKKYTPQQLSLISRLPKGTSYYADSKGKFYITLKDGKQITSDMITGGTKKYTAKELQTIATMREGTVVAKGVPQQASKPAIVTDKGSKTLSEGLNDLKKSDVQTGQKGLYEQQKTKFYIQPSNIRGTSHNILRPGEVEIPKKTPEDSIAKNKEILQSDEQNYGTIGLTREQLRNKLINTEGKEAEILSNIYLRREFLSKVDKIQQEQGIKTDSLKKLNVILKEKGDLEYATSLQEYYKAGGSKQNIARFQAEGGLVLQKITKVAPIKKLSKPESDKNVNIYTTSETLTPKPTQRPKAILEADIEKQKQEIWKKYYTTKTVDTNTLKTVPQGSTTYVPSYETTTVLKNPILSKLNPFYLIASSNLKSLEKEYEDTQIKQLASPNLSGARLERPIDIQNRAYGELMSKYKEKVTWDNYRTLTDNVKNVEATMTYSAESPTTLRYTLPDVSKVQPEKISEIKPYDKKLFSGITPLQQQKAELNKFRAVEIGKLAGTVVLSAATLGLYGEVATAATAIKLFNIGKIVNVGLKVGTPLFWTAYGLGEGINAYKGIKNIAEGNTFQGLMGIGGIAARTAGLVYGTRLLQATGGRPYTAMAKAAQSRILRGQRYYTSEQFASMNIKPRSVTPEDYTATSTFLKGNKVSTNVLETSQKPILRIGVNPLRSSYPIDKGYQFIVKRKMPMSEIILGKNENLLLHGTSDVFLENIKSEGLKPMKGLIYFTYLGNYARFRANQAAQKYGGKAIIIAVEKTADLNMGLAKGRHVVTNKIIPYNKIIKIVPAENLGKYRTQIRGFIPSDINRALPVELQEFSETQLYPKQLQTQIFPKPFVPESPRVKAERLINPEPISKIQRAIQNQAQTSLTIYGINEPIPKDIKDLLKVKLSKLDKQLEFPQYNIIPQENPELYELRVLKTLYPQAIKIRITPAKPEVSMKEPDYSKTTKSLKQFGFKDVLKDDVIKELQNQPKLTTVQEMEKPTMTTYTKVPQKQAKELVSEIKDEISKNKQSKVVKNTYPYPTSGYEIIEAINELAILSSKSPYSNLNDVLIKNNKFGNIKEAYEKLGLNREEIGKILSSNPRFANLKKMFEEGRDNPFHDLFDKLLNKKRKKNTLLIYPEMEYVSKLNTKGNQEQLKSMLYSDSFKHTTKQNVNNLKMMLYGSKKEEKFKTKSMLSQKSNLKYFEMSKMKMPQFDKRLLNEMRTDLGQKQVSTFRQDTERIYDLGMKSVLKQDYDILQLQQLDLDSLQLQQLELDTITQPDEFKYPEPWKPDNPPPPPPPPPPPTFFELSGGSKPQKRKKRKIYKPGIPFYTPDFTAKILGIEMKANKNLLKKLLKQSFTGLEIRAGIVQ